MTHRRKRVESRGYCAIGIYRSKFPPNVGSLWRSAQQLQAAGCSLLFTIGKRFPEQARINAFRACKELNQASDTMKAPRHMPWLDFESVDALRAATPSAKLVGIEIDDRAVALPGFKHPERAIYLLGAEDDGITRADRDACDEIVIIPGGNLNVAVAGSLVLYDRMVKGGV